MLLSGGVDSSVIVALLAEGGQHELRTFSVGFESTGGESGDEVGYSDLVARHFDTTHEKITVSSGRLLPSVDRAVAAINEPMVSHDCVAFYLLAEEVSKSVTVVQSGQGADEVFAGSNWYPLLAEVASELISENFAAPGAPSTLDAALRLDSSVMLVDDPVKRVDNMAMAWSWKDGCRFWTTSWWSRPPPARPSSKLAGGGRGVLEQACRGLVPDEVRRRGGRHHRVRPARRR